MKRRLLPLLLVVLLLCPACGSQQAAEPENAKPPISETRRQASKQADLLLTAFGRDESGENIYPEEYAGHYIGEDDLLHILIVDGTEPGCYDYIVDANRVRYETAQHSLNALIKLKADLWENVLELGFQDIYINQESNVVIMSVPEEDRIAPLIAALDKRGVDRNIYTVEISTIELLDDVQPTPVTAAPYVADTAVIAVPGDPPTLEYVQGQYQRLLASFGSEPDRVYPDEYAGVYLDDDGYLKILLTIEAHGIYDDRIDARIVRYDTVPYSFNQLTALRDLLSAHAADLHLTSFGVDQSENIVAITVPAQKYADALTEFLDRQQFPSGMYCITLGVITPA